MPSPSAIAPVFLLASLSLAACATGRGPRPAETAPEAPPPSPPTAQAEPSPSAAVPSLQSLGEGQWVLREWDQGEAAPAEPAVTLQLQEGRFVGRSGCNLYSGPVSEQTPGHISVGDTISTKKLCRPPAMQVEMRYLQQLSQVRAFCLVEGQLTLTYEKDGASGVMRFERQDVVPEKTLE